jgi:hypothetical protein
MPEYRTPGVYIEEVSGGPRPVQASATTDTGFVAVLTLPGSFLAGRGLAAGLFLPAPEEAPRLTWNRALAFRSLFHVTEAPPPAPAAAPAEGEKPDPKAPKKPAAPTAGDNRLRSLVEELLPGRWEVKAPGPDGTVTFASDKGDVLRVPASRTLFSVKEANGQKEWDLSFGADAAVEQRFLELLSAYALASDVRHSGALPAVDPGARPVNLDVDAIHDRLIQPAPSITNMAGYGQWRAELGEKLFKEIVQQAQKVSEARAHAMWEGLGAEARRAWDRWLRAHPGLHRLEIALQGFFENGGATAYPALIIHAHGAAGPNKRTFLEQSFDSVGNVAMLAAPGLGLAWQQAILEYAGPKGRGDLFAVAETPRYLLTREPRGASLNDARWTRTESPYEVDVLEALPSPESTELRFLGYANDQLLDRTIPRDDTGHGAAYGPWLIVENPLSTGPSDRYVIAPPSGHVAGVIAATDLKAGGGVHKAPANEQVLGVAALVTEISDREQGPLNTKGVNIIRHRPGGGIRVWGGRTVASDPTWRYVNVRRLFLFVERSVRDAVNWAVFLPNNDVTRRDLATTIRSFLYSLWAQGMLDGATHTEAYTVKCDRENNPDVDIRSGIMTVDVMFKPPYPAEFVRIRFRQTPMEVPQ